MNAENKAIQKRLKELTKENDRAVKQEKAKVKAELETSKKAEQMDHICKRVVQR
jgi:hypothetical protein